MGKRGSDDDDWQLQLHQLQQQAPEFLLSHVCVRMNINTQVPAHTHILTLARIPTCFASLSHSLPFAARHLHTCPPCDTTHTHTHDNIHTFTSTSCLVLLLLPPQLMQPAGVKLLQPAHSCILSSLSLSVVRKTLCNVYAF